MNYQDLNALHLEQVRKQNDWLTQLFQASLALRNAIENMLSPPDHWDHKGQPTPYVRVAKVSHGKAPEKITLNDRHANVEGAFVFGIIITFESSPKTYPKTDHWLSVGVRITLDSQCGLV